MYLVIFLVSTSQSTDSTDHLEHTNKSREGVSPTINPIQLAKNLKSEISKTLESEPPGFSEAGVGQDEAKSSGKRIHPRKGVDPNATLVESKEDLAINNSSSVIPLIPSLIPPVINNISSTQEPAAAVKSNNATEPLLNNTTIKIVSTLTMTTEKPIILTTGKPPIKPIAKKPPVTYSADDDPEIIDQEKKYLKLAKKNNEAVKNSKENFVEEPLAELSKEPIIVKESHRQYFIYIILLFALPTFLGLITIAVKKFRENWSTRQYRRVDFLVDGMYDN